MREANLVKRKTILNVADGGMRTVVGLCQGSPLRSHAQPALDSSIQILLAVLIISSPLLDTAAPHFQTLVVQLGALSVFILWCLKEIARGGIRLQHKSISLTGFALVITCFISAINAAYVHDGLVVFNLVFVAFLLFLVVLNLDSLDVSTILCSLTAVSMIEAGYGLYQFCLQNVERAKGTFFNPNYYAGFLAISVSVLIAGLLFKDDKGNSNSVASGTFLRSLMRVCWILSILFLLTSIVLSGSRGVMSAIALALLFLFSLKGRRWVFGYLIVGTLFLTLVPNPFAHRLRNLDTEDPYAYSRIQIWKNTYSMIKDYPIFGVGLGMYSRYSPQYAFPSEEIWVRYDRQADMAHSEIFQMTSELGLIGLFWMVCGLGLVGEKILVDLKQRNWMQAKGLHLGLVAGLLVVVVQSLVDSNLHNPAILLATASILGILMRRGVGVDNPMIKKSAGNPEKRYVVYLSLFFLVVGSYFFLPYLAHYNFLDGIKKKQSNLELKKAALLNPLSASYQQSLAGFYFDRFIDTGDYSSLIHALNHLKKAITLDKRDWIYHKQLGDIYIQLSRNDRLLSGLNSSGNSVFRSSDGYSDAKKSEEQHNLIQLALRSYETAIELKPFHPMLRLGMGTIYYNLGDYDKSRNEIGRAVDLEPYFLQARYYLGKLNEEVGRIDEALGEFDEMARIRTLKIMPASRYQQELLNFDFSELKKELRRLSVASDYHDRIEHTLAVLEKS